MSHFETLPNGSPQAESQGGHESKPPIDAEEELTAEELNILLSCGHQFTRKDVAILLGISPARVLQLENRAIEKCRQEFRKMFLKRRRAGE